MERWADGEMGGWGENLTFTLSSLLPSAFCLLPSAFCLLPSAFSSAFYLLL